MKLEIGNHPNFEIRKEIHIHGMKKPFSILYLCDLHFNKWSETMVRKIIDCIDQLNPSLLLMGGDYVDSKKGLHYFKTLMKAIAHRENIFAIAGNHDYFWGLKTVQKVITENNGHWIEKSSNTIRMNGINVQIDGNKLSSSIEADFRILCLHKPINLEQHNYDLAFAGHLHGGQLVLKQTKKGLYPGRIFYKWNRLKIKFNSTILFISKGLGDTLPIRFNCKKDVIFINIQNQNKTSK